MTKLIRADLIRMFRARVLHVMLILFALLLLFEGWICSGEDVDAGEHLFSSLLFGMGTMLLPMFASIGICLIIGAEFNSGGIRNKMTVGHNRQSIYGSWLICSCIVTLVMTALLIVMSLLSAVLFGLKVSDISVKATVINMLVYIVSLFSYTAVVVFFSTLLTGYKSVAVAFIYSEVVMMIFTMLGEIYKNNEAFKLISRFFVQAQSETYTALKVTDTPWLTALCCASLGIVVTIAGITSFRNKDLK